MSRSSEEERFLSLVPEDGSGVGNKNLREQLGWDEEKYWPVRERLLEKGTITRGPGQGGSVKRVLGDEDPEEPAAELVNEAGGRRRGRLSDEEKLLSLIPADGSGIGNKNLREQLGWDEEKYLKVRDRLLEKESIARGPGQGGSVKKVVDDEEPAEDLVSEVGSGRRGGKLGDERKLLSLTPEDGSSIGNKNLREQLGWEEERYWPVRDRLVEKGSIARGPGNGGSVKRILDDDDAEPEETTEEASNESSGGRRGKLSDERKLLSLIPEDGSSVGNKNLREQLGWEEERYWPVRDRLVEKGSIARGPGNGGSVKRILDDAEPEETTEEAEEKEKPRRSIAEALRGLQARGLEKDVREISKPEEIQARRAANRPRVFIGSSGEGREIAEWIQEGLEHVAECTIWWQGVFGLSGGTLESLVAATKRFDFAVLVLTPDDMTTKRSVTKNAPRDNVLFELGLFMGAIGRERTFIVHYSDKERELDLPTDLAGVSTARFHKRSDGNLQAALGPVCTRMKDVINRAFSAVTK